jgi:hypothetical protein
MRKMNGGELMFKKHAPEDYPMRIGKSLASSLAGFIAGFIAGSVGWIAIIYMLSPLCKR